MFVCMNSESMLGGEVKNSGEMLTIIMPFSKPKFYPNSGIPAVFSGQEFRWNSSWSCPEYQRHTGNNSSRIPAECLQ